jgi:hypothetical protein
MMGTIEVTDPAGLPPAPPSPPVQPLPVTPTFTG